MKNYVKEHPYLVLGLLFALLFLAANQLLAVTDSAESNYALTAKEMIQSGDWLSPQIYGHYWYDKPIFYYWELALSFSLFGMNEWAARFPAAVTGILNIWFIFWFASRVYGRKVGFVSALILGTSLEFWVLSKAIVTDSTLFLFMNGAIAFFYLGYTEDKRYYWLCYVLAALAVLTKGPIGLALPGLAALVFLAWKRDLKELAHVHLFTGTLLFLLVCGPWYLFMTMDHGYAFLLNFFGVHNFLRATVPEHTKNAHWWFYLVMYVAGFFPWSFITIPAIYRSWKKKELYFPNAQPATQLLVIWALAVYVVFECIATKYTTYTFPAFFAQSILAALLLTRYQVKVTGKAALTGAVYLLLSFTLIPAVMYMRSGKGTAEVLRMIPADGRPIVAEHGYRTSTVFYSGKTIYRLVDGKDEQKLMPGTLSWNAKNVMPFYKKEDLPREAHGYIVIDYPEKDIGNITVYSAKGIWNSDTMTGSRGTKTEWIIPAGITEALERVYER